MRFDPLAGILAAVSPLLSHVLLRMHCLLAAIPEAETSEGVCEGVKNAVLRYPVHGLWESEATRSHRHHLPACSQQLATSTPTYKVPTGLPPMEAVVKLVSWPWGMRIWAKACDNRTAEVSNATKKHALQRHHASQSCFTHALSHFCTSYGDC